MIAALPKSREQNPAYRFAVNDLKDIPFGMSFYVKNLSP